MRYEHTRLPGIGELNVLATAQRRCVGVVRHRLGRRELVVYDAQDADAVATSVVLTEGEAESLAEILGQKAAPIHVARLDRHSAGLVCAQVFVTPATGRRVVDDVGRRAGPEAVLVAVIRGDVVLCPPSPEVRLLPGDVVVVISSMDAAFAVIDLLTHD